MRATETMRTRLVMAGALVGALVLLALSVVFSWPVTVTGASPNPLDEASAAFDSPAGTCLNWPADNPRAMERVDCARPHLFEVTSNVEIAAEYAPNVPPPGEQQWQEIAVDKCTPGVTAFLGGRLDPFGKYQVSALKPTDDQWRAGDRKLRCGVNRVTTAGTRLTTTGSAANQDQSNIFDPGTCFGLKDKQVGEPVDCGVEHAIEIVGNIDLSVAFPGAFPPAEEQGTKLSELCAQAATQYSGGRPLAEQRLTVFWDTLREESWAAGSRKVDCKVGTLLPDGTGLGPIQGSVRAVETPPASPPPSTPGG